MRCEQCIHYTREKSEEQNRKKLLLVLRKQETQKSPLIIMKEKDRRPKRRRFGNIETVALEQIVKESTQAPPPVRVCLTIQRDCITEHVLVCFFQKVIERPFIDASVVERLETLFFNVLPHHQKHPSVVQNHPRYVEVGQRVCNHGDSSKVAAAFLFSVAKCEAIASISLAYFILPVFCFGWVHVYAPSEVVRISKAGLYIRMRVKARQCNNAYLAGGGEAEIKCARNSISLHTACLLVLRPRYRSVNLTMVRVLVRVLS